MNLISISVLAATMMVALPFAPKLYAQTPGPVNEEDRAKFEELYRDKLVAVNRSQDTDDDRKLAEQMIELAETIPDSPGVQCLIYIEVIPLAAVGGDIESAVRAADQLESVWPGHEAADPDALLAIVGRTYREASRDERDQVAQPYMDLLLHSAERAEANEDLDRAIDLCRQANTVARVVDSDRRGYIVDTLDRLSEVKAVLSQIDMLVTAVEKNPKNISAAKELVNLLIVERDEPATAAQYVELTGDPDLTEVVTVCADGIDSAGAPEALRVGDWYLVLADQEDDDLAEPLLRRAQRWYGRFLSVYTREDALAQRVERMRLIAESRAKRIVEARRAALRGRWIDLVGTTFEPAQHVLGKAVEVRRGEIHTLTPTALVLPVTPQGSFELRVRLTMHERTSGLALHVPIGRTAATFYYSRLDNTTSSIEGLDEADFAKKRMNKPGQKVALIFQGAVLEEGELALAMLVDGDESLRWQGSANNVQANEEFAPPQTMGRILRLNCGGKMTIHSIELRERAE